ncbi:glycoside hydrolase [Penicillium angulare]|uniref:Glycoside hydrolase n=1 Tax=Penicillium angulare TaxID=116970 RepID=A0A9W9GDV3_9EURO|nr:glycoside hydrolase [Penicillium angulare]
MASSLFFVGEWALQTLYSNTVTYANRKDLFDTLLDAWSYYGIPKDYWSYKLLIDAGVITKARSLSLMPSTAREA